MMDEIFFLYYEELDWAAPIERAAYKLYFDGRSLVKHKESISTVKDSPFQIFYLTRGRILYARRNNKGVIKLLSLLFLNLISMPKIMLFYALKGKVNLSKAVCKAVWWNLTHKAENK
ncbi:MAG TPA: glycosyltransferase family 2 protein, partial [Bacteroidales bacterium]|nr:glycosyltransferase family 2 protein [Bacteroidales bacterium]